MRLPLLAAFAALLQLPASASAFVIQEHGGLQSATNGIALGPDGNIWAVEGGNGTVVRLSPDGTPRGRFAVGAGPTSIAAGPGGRMWVAVSGADKLVYIDALSATPTVHDIPTDVFSDCGPVAVEPGGNGRIYFSMPSQSGCVTPDKLGYTNDDGTGATGVAEGRGRAFDLQVFGGKLYAPDFEGNVVRRMALDDALTVESAVSVSTGNPDGITADGTGRIWVTLFTAGKVAHFPAAQTNGMATELTPVGGSLGLPFGIVAGPDGHIFVTGSDTANLARLDPATATWTFYPAPGGRPWQIVNGPDRDLWFSDIATSRVMRFVDDRPRATTGQAEALAATAATLKASVDPRGNATSVVFDYGTTAAFGKTSAPVNVAQGVGAVDVQAGVNDLAPSTTYFVRVRATNARGETAGSTTTFTTPAGVVDADGDRVSPPADCNDANPAIHTGATDVPGDGIDQDCKNGDAAFPRLGAVPRFSWSLLRNGQTRLTKVRAQRLAGGETVRITCKGRGCPFKSKTFRRLKAGTRKFDRYFRGKRLRPKARVQMRITKPATIGTVRTLTMRRLRDPKIVDRCLKPGSSVLTKC